MIILIALVSLVGPLLISLFEILLRKLTTEKARLVFHGLAIGVLLSIVIWDWLTDHGHDGTFRDLLLLVFAFLFAWLFIRFELIRNFALMFSLATVVVIVSFAVSYPIWSTVGPHRSAMEAQQTDSESPVVMVIFDELPLAALENKKRRIDAGHFPTFGEIAGTSTWYPDMKAVGDQTTFAVPSMMTGNDPAENDDPAQPPPPGLPRYPDNVCSILKDAGYEVHAYEPVTDLCDRSYGLGTRLSGVLHRATGWSEPGLTFNPGYLADMLVAWFARPFDRPYTEYGPDRPLAVSEFVEGMPGSDRSISVLHIALPHIQWMFQPDGSTYPNRRDAADTQLETPPTAGENSRDMQMMILQLAYADRQLKRVVDRMKEQGIWESSLFVVTADHGGGFQTEASRRLINLWNPGWILPVPLLIKQPGQTQGTVVRGPVDSRDVGTTILGRLGLKPGEDATGRDLTTLEHPPARDSFEGHGLFGDFSLDSSLVEKEFRQARQHRNRLFPGSLYAVGGREDLLGSKPDGMRRLGFELDSPEAYEEVDTASGELPAWVEGRLTDAGDPPPPGVAVALNGKIVAIAPVWEKDGVVSTGVVVPAAGFFDGRNVVAVYAIPGPPPKAG